VDVVAEVAGFLKTQRKSALDVRDDLDLTGFC